LPKHSERQPLATPGNPWQPLATLGNPWQPFEALSAKYPKIDFRNQHFDKSILQIFDRKMTDIDVIGYPFKKLN